ncbi:MAG: AEC family transporter [Alphaproteobacteria bacterium]|jgi:predicted permease|nr:AEC family transporter [Alphaproteobacteria bacterium]MBU1562842.1 AEC family transporter [Alphaproteobacteria bacterium]MBU2302154.1 AEC family transporter [Alphaproteobacteria bacterium]MBU2368162.1 AEC family transporter [Alphaproteobacteria bacterium]
MLAILTVIAPVFALMALGYGAVRFRLYPAEGIKSLIAFVNNFATPCLLFYSLVTSDFSAAFNPAILGPFYLGALICFAIGIVIALKLFGNTPGEAVSVGFSGTFTNTVLIGLPIMQRAYGADALPVTLSIIGVHGAILLTVGMVTMELMRRDGASLGKTLVVAVRRVASNPLIWGIAAGMIGYFSGLQLIEPAEAFLVMMSSAVVPAALFGIGGALNEFKLSDNWKQALVASAIKLIVHPAIAYVLMIWVLRVPMDIARYGILLSAMPAGVNVYVFATYYNRSVSVAANTILIATIASAVTISGWLYILTL